MALLHGKDLQLQRTHRNLLLLAEHLFRHQQPEAGVKGKQLKQQAVQRHLQQQLHLLLLQHLLLLLPRQLHLLVHLVLCLAQLGENVNSKVRITNNLASSSVLISYAESGSPVPGAPSTNGKTDDFQEVAPKKPAGGAYRPPGRREDSGTGAAGGRTGSGRW